MRTPDAPQAPKENLFDRLITVGVWSGAILATAIVLWLVVVLVRWGLGDVDIPFGVAAAG